MADDIVHVDVDKRVGGVLIGQEEGWNVPLGFIIHSICKIPWKVEILPDKDGNNPDEDGNNDSNISLDPPVPSQQDATAVAALNAKKSATNEYDAVAFDACKSNATVSANNDLINPPLMHLIPQNIWLIIVELFGTRF